ncbi:MAG: hypothetical protein J6X37_01175 [Treponema sp.]|nr:hypothetical protein [Treponema sp.]
MNIQESFNQDFNVVSEYINKMLILQKSQYFSSNENSEQKNFSCSYLIKPGLIVEIYSFIEFYLEKLVDLPLMTNGKDSYSNFIKKKHFSKRTSNLFKMISYINTFLKRDITKSLFYNDIDNLRTIRNAIVHKGNFVKKLLNIKHVNCERISKKTNICFITVQDEFFTLILKSINNFFEALFTDFIYNISH